MVQCLTVLLDVIDFLCTLVGVDKLLYTQDRGWRLSVRRQHCNKHGVFTFYLKHPIIVCLEWIFPVVVDYKPTLISEPKGEIDKMH